MRARDTGGVVFLADKRLFQGILEGWLFWPIRGCFKGSDGVLIPLGQLSHRSLSDWAEELAPGRCLRASCVP